MKRALNTAFAKATLAQMEALLELVGLIYEASQDPKRWPLFLERYSSAVQCHVSQLELISVETKLSIAACWGLSDADRRECETCDAPNPWRPLLFNAQAGDVGLSHEVVPDKIYRTSPYYREFGRRIDQYYGLAGVAIKSPSDVCVLASVRGGKAGPSTENDRRLLQALMPHLARSLQMHREFVKLQVQASSLFECLDRMERGFVILDRKGNLVRANREAEEISRQNDGIRLSTRGLGTATAHETRSLQKLIHDAAAAASGDGLSSGGVLAISRPSNRRPWIAVISPHRGSQAEGFASVLLIDTDRTPPPSAQVVARLFGFTRAETRLAMVLAQGMRLEEAAERLAITINTARTHTRRILEKAGVRRQSDLVLVLNRLPRVE